MNGLQWKGYLAVAVGGALGALARWGAGALLMARWPGPFPLITFGINMLGSALIGAVAALTSRGPASPLIRLFLATGFLGGFTTFSGFAAEVKDLMGPHPATGATYAVLSLLVGPLFAATVEAGVRDLPSAHLWRRMRARLRAVRQQLNGD